MTSKTARHSWKLVFLTGRGRLRLRSGASIFDFLLSRQLRLLVDGPTLPNSVEFHGCEQQDAVRYHLIIAINAQKRHSIGKHADNDGSEHCAKNFSRSAIETCASQQDRCDD